MKLLKNKIFALFLMIIMILSSIIFGSYRSLTEFSKQTQEVFYKGENNDGISIQNSLDQRLNAAYDLISLGRKHFGVNDDVVKEVSTARDNLIQASSPSEKYIANNLLTEATDKLCSKLDIKKITDSDSKTLSNIEIKLDSANDSINQNKYNQCVENFYYQLNSMPASFFNKIFEIEQVEFYR